MKRKKTRYPGVVEYRTQEGDIIYYISRALKNLLRRIHIVSLS